jgi:hypothetical protein
MTAQATVTVDARSERLDTQTILSQIFTEKRPYTQLRHEIVTYSQANGTVYTLDPVGNDRMLVVEILEAVGDVTVTWVGDSIGLTTNTQTLPAGRIMSIPGLVDATAVTFTIGTSATIEFLVLGEL